MDDLSGGRHERAHHLARDLAKDSERPWTPPAEPTAEDAAEAGQEAPDDARPPLGSWRLEIDLPDEDAADVSARLLAARPAWDLASRAEGLTMPCPPQVRPDLQLVREVLKTARRGRCAKTRVALRWRPEAPETAPLTQTGPWELAVAAEPRPETDARRLYVPRPLSLSPRLRVWTSLAVAALTDFLTPPPGARDTRGGRTLILDGGPGLLAAAALRSGAGHVMAVCGSQAEARNLRLTAELNGRADAFEAL
ncbi:MAG: hypothetical protein LBU12_05645, partial [Deltaproteobacteria bacterium]|nr:hypothetical protein [Deltaproteobacteria bacterium]